MSKETSTKVIQMSTIMGLVSGDANSQAKLVDEVEDETGYDNVSYHSVDEVVETSQEQKEDKPKSKRLNISKPKLDDLQIMDYVKGNIFQRKCCCFLPTKEAKDLCQCGLKRDSHDTTVLPDPTHNHSNKQKWDDDTCTAKVPVNSFGLINFDGFGQEASRKAPYIRVEHQTDTKVLWELLKTHWKIPEPKLIISITGGAKRLFIKSRLMNSFRRGLINAATAADAWIVTGGTNTGVMEIVGDAVHDYMLQMGVSGRRIVLLGIATWGYVANKASLTINEKTEDKKAEDNLIPSRVDTKNNTDIAPTETTQGEAPVALAKEPATAESPEIETESPPEPPVKIPVLHRAKYQFDDLRSPENQGRIALNPYHSHFILVDNGTDGKPGFEINLRANLEQHIARECEGQVVLLVLEGGEKTLETASEAIDRDTPVVIIKGSGRAADVIAYAYYKYKTLQEKTKGMDKSSEEKATNAFKEEVMSKSSKAFDWVKERDPKLKAKRTETGMMHLMKILAKINLIVIYNLDDSNAASSEMDQAILKALLQAQPNDTQSQLGLALAWNCCDVARQEIFSLETRLQWQRIDLDSSMHTALVENKMDFAQLFMDSGVNLKSFLTVDRLKQLYYDVLNDDHPDSCTELLKNLISEQQKPSCFMWCQGNHSNEDDDGIRLEAIGDVIIRLTSDQQENVYAGIETQSEKFFLYPERELFYFSLLLGRKDMAVQFWRCGRDHIGGALTACVIWRNLAQIAEHEEELDLCQELDSNAQEFESIAVGVLNQCYQIDKKVAHMLLTRELDIWGSRTLFMIADDAAQMDFTEQSCCQTQLNKSWTGRMAAHTQSWKIFFGLILITIPLIKFTKEERKLVETDVDGDNVDDAQAEGHFYAVGMVTNERRNTIGILQAIYLFLMAPLVKFFYYLISQVIYLGLFSFFLLTNLRPITEPNSPGTCEIIVWFWTLTLIMEEIRQVFAAETTTFSSKLSYYFGSVWNQFDVLIYLIFIISFTLRFTLYDDDLFDWARIMYTFTLLAFFVRLLQFFFVHKDIGPKVIMLRGMLTDLLTFILLLAIFIVSYGIAARVLLYPNAPPSWNILASVLYEPYFQLYGNLNLDEALGVRDSTCPSNDTYYNDNPSSEHCPKTSWTVVVVLSVELLLTNILLLNLLIAMFSYTFSVIQENSAKVWRYYRYSLIYEYYSKPVLPPPLIILCHIWRFGRYLYHRCFNKDYKAQHHFKRTLAFDENKKLTAVERAGMENHLIRRQRAIQDQIDFKVSSTSEKIEKMIDELELLKEQLDSQKDVRNLANPGSPAAAFGSINLSSSNLSKLTTASSALDSVPSRTNADIAFGKETRSELSAVHSRLDRQDEMLQKLLNLMEEGVSHKHSSHHQKVKVVKGGGTESLPKVDS